MPNKSIQYRERSPPGLILLGDAQRNSLLSNWNGVYSQNKCKDVSERPVLCR